MKGHTWIDGINTWAMCVLLMHFSGVKVPPLLFWTPFVALGAFGALALFVWVVERAKAPWEKPKEVNE